MSTTWKAKVDDLCATESLQLSKNKIYKMRAAIKALEYGAEKVSSTKRRQFQVCLNRAQQAAPLGHMLIVTRQSSDWSAISIK
jgi:hypothetical protein